MLASKAGHREIADLIAAGGSPAGRHALPTQAPARKREDSTVYTYDQLRVGNLKRPCIVLNTSACIQYGEGHRNTVAGRNLCQPIRQPGSARNTLYTCDQL